MAQHGWGGNPPSTETEARQRIIDGTARLVDAYGVRKTTLSDVAAELDVTRQTVYRYFARLSDILGEVAAQGAEAFVNRIVEHVRGITDPAEAVVEGLLFSVRTIPTEPRLSLLLQLGDTGAFVRGATSDATVRYGAQMLRRYPVDWSAAGLGEEDLDGLAELIMRLLTSLLQNPPPPERTEEQLRAWLRRWVAPAVTSRG